jgi:hypothetical protein
MTLRILSAVATIALTAALGTPGRMDAGPCLTDSDGSLLATRKIQLYMLRLDSTKLATQGLLPADTAAVSIVTDSTTCAGAVAAYNARVSQRPALNIVDAVYVVQAGPSRYVVHSPVNQQGEFTAYMVFENLWHLIKEWHG